MGGSLLYDEVLAIYAKYPHYRNIKFFVETGTYKAETSCNMSPHFEKVFTIEIYEPLYKEAIKLKSRYPNIQFILGDSTKILGPLLSALDCNAVFFLDAHVSGNDSSHGDLYVPLLAELDILLSIQKEGNIYIIDDVRLFDKYWDWAGITTEIILAKFDTFSREYYIENDRLYILT